MNESLAILGEDLQPLANGLLQFGSFIVDACSMGIEAITSLIEAFDNLGTSADEALIKAFSAMDSQYNLADYQANGLVNAGGVIDYAAAKQMQDAGTFKRASKVSRSDALNRGWNTTYVGDLVWGDSDLMWKAMKSMTEWGKKRKGINGSHVNGLDYVPFDGYVAELHQGEAVLTSGEASFLRSAMAAGRTLGSSQRSSRGVSDSDTGGSGGTPKVYDLTIPVELTIDGATFARKEYKYRIAEDNRRGVSLAGRGGTR